MTTRNVTLVNNVTEIDNYQCTRLFSTSLTEQGRKGLV
jgi:hypothetical protein